MDSFPPRKAFNDILQNPSFAFRDPELRQVTIERDAMGLPRARAGTFADVYRAIFPNGGSRAVRVFASAQPERQERYQAIHNHLSRQSLGCLVPFTYTEKGIRAPNGKWYPLITMEWVVGDTLFDWLAKRTDANDGRTIAAVSDRWRTTAQGLIRAKIAHGDLQHANVLVTDSNEIKLVDYDGMCVPQLVGRRNLEIGVEPYQHPARDANTTLSLGLDNFSSMFIYVALKALSAEPRIWSEFVARPLYDKILFRKEDLEDPAKSALFGRLRRSPDSEVQRLSTTLCELSRVRIDQVPCLEELLVTFDFNSVRSCLDRRDFDAAIGLLTRSGKQATDAPLDLQPRIRDAQQRVAKLAELVAAVDSGNERGMVAIVSSPLLQNYPGAVAAISVAKEAPGVMPAIQRLDAARAGRRWRDLVREWDASQGVLTRPNGRLRKSAAAYETDAASWRARNKLCDQVLASIRNPQPDLAALQVAWTTLTGMGGHPECDAHAVTIGRLLAAHRPAQASKQPLAQPASRPQPPIQPQPPRPLSGPAAQMSPQAASTPQAVPQPIPQPVSQPGSRPAGRQTMTGPSYPVGSRPAVHAGAGSTGSSALRTAWSVFLTEAFNSAAALTLRWVPPARWLARRIPAGAISPHVIMKSIVLALAATTGAFGGAFVGEAFISLDAAWRSPLVQSSELVRVFFVSLGAVAAFLIGQNRSIGGRWLPSWRQLLTAVFVVCGAVAVSAAIDQMIPHRSLSDVDSWPALGLSICRSLLQWGMIGVLLGLGATRIIPNLKAVPAAIGGVAAGVTAAIGAVMTSSTVNETSGVLIGAGFLGISFGMITALIEAATRDFFLDVDRGQGLSPVRIGLGSRPVTAGSDASSCDVVVPASSRPLAFKYWVDQQQVYLLDYASNQPTRVSLGDRRQLGPVSLTVSRNTQPVLPTGSRPVPLAATQPPVAPPASAVQQVTVAMPSSRRAAPAPLIPPPPKAP
jgi:hypothetical protein